MRIFHRLLAAILFRFWTQCPRCLKHFGGHQRYAKHVAFKGENKLIVTYRYVCPKCAKLAIVLE